MQTFTWLDYSVFVIYLLGTAAIGTRFVRGERTLSEYCFGGAQHGQRGHLDDDPGGPLCPGVSFLAVPAEGFANGPVFYLVNLSFSGSHRDCRSRGPATLLVTFGSNGATIRLLPRRALCISGNCSRTVASGAAGNQNSCHSAGSEDGPRPYCFPSPSCRRAARAAIVAPLPGGTRHCLRRHRHQSPLRRP